MALYKRGDTWWLSISHAGKRLQKSTGTTEKVAAQRFHDQVKAELWQQQHLGVKPQHTWKEAVMRWLQESQHKRSLKEDQRHLRWVDSYLGDCTLSQITRDLLERIATDKEKRDVEPSTVNRLMATVRCVLRKAEREWDWLDKAPNVRMRKEENKRIRWLTPVEAYGLIQELPPHLSDMAAFTLATGLRCSNVTHLQWTEIDWSNQHAWIHPDQAKGKKAIPVPLNTNAIAILQKWQGKHPQFVFTYKDVPIRQCNTKAWRKALIRAGIENFRWHDLRHTWASWHVQNGTSLHELQQLGGWRSHEMVLRYAHLGGRELKQAAERIHVTNLLHSHARPSVMEQ
jgi:integrase